MTQEFTLKNMTSKKGHHILFRRVFLPPTSRNKFTREMDITDNDWKYLYFLLFIIIIIIIVNIYNAPCLSTIEVKTRLFQYKTNTNCLLTNYR